MTVANTEKGSVERDSELAKDRFVKGTAGGKAGGVDLANRTIHGIASTIQLDRDGEIIMPSAFKRTIAQFLVGSAAFLDAHQHRGDGPTQIGWVLDMRINGPMVPCDFRFVDDDDSTSPANRWWKLAKDPNGKGISFSIGFIPVRWVYGSAADLVREFPELKEPIREAGLKGEDKLRVYTEIELLEISAVPVPANRESLQLLAAKMFGREVDDAAAQKAMEKFAADLAAAVTEKLITEPSSADEIAAVLAAVIAVNEKLSELTELVLLSPGERSWDAAIGTDPDDSRDMPRPAGESNGADAGAAKVSKAARELIKQCDKLGK